MDSAAMILVIILAIMLAIFLLLAIVLAIVLIRISTQIKNITESAEKTVNTVERTASNFSKFTSPASAVRLVRGIVKVRKRR